MPGTLIVSLDFELFWGMQDCVELSRYADHVQGGREAIPKLLRLFENHGIHATWATVGFQFAGSKGELLAFLPGQRPEYENPALSTYRCLEKIGEDEETAPCFFAASLLKKIAACPGQEVASHTFSHYYCREKGQTPEQFRADMTAAKRIAEAGGYSLTSVVFPRNQTKPQYVSVLRELGFTAYRDEENDWIHEKVGFVPLKRLLRLADVYLPLTGLGGYTPRQEGGIVNLMGSRMYKPYFAPLGFLEGLKLHRIKKQMLFAAKTGKTFHLWWHPHNIGVRTEYHLRQLEEIFSYYERLRDRYGMRSRNMAEAAREALKES